MHHSIKLALSFAHKNCFNIFIKQSPIHTRLCNFFLLLFFGLSYESEILSQYLHRSLLNPRVLLKVYFCNLHLKANFLNHKHSLTLCSGSRYIKRLWKLLKPQHLNDFFFSFHTRVPRKVFYVIKNALQFFTLKKFFLLLLPRAHREKISCPITSRSNLRMKKISCTASVKSESSF